jgi:phenylpyruvate tautomerase PptA (4-oxalocrotonate tautomerase family)
MPILDVGLVLGAGEEVPTGLAAAVADAAAAVFGTPAGGTWVKVHGFSAERYAENGGPTESRPVFVRVMRAHLPVQLELEQEAPTLAAAIARACGRPVENVHIIYEPPAAGRIAFGGKLLKGPAA